MESCVRGFLFSDRIPEIKTSEIKKDFGGVMQKALTDSNFVVRDDRAKVESRGFFLMTGKVFILKVMKDGKEIPIDMELESIDVREKTARVSFFDGQMKKIYSEGDELKIYGRIYKVKRIGQKRFEKTTSGHPFERPCIEFCLKD
jgi:hypothetical protein